MLKAILNSLDNVPSEIANLYVEIDGRFVLDVEPTGGFALEDVTGLKSSLSKERQNARTAQKALDAFDGLNVDEAREALGKVGEMSTWTPDDKVREQINAREKQLTSKHVAELDKANGELTAIRGQLETQLIQASAMEAIASMGGNVQLLMPHIKSQTRMEMVDGKFVAQVIDENGVPRVSMKTGSTDGMTINELVGSMRDAETFAPAFAGSGATGSGTASTSAAGSGANGNIKMSWEEAHNPEHYRAKKAQAESAGSNIEIQSFDA